jgi:hypothetical protein
MYRFREDVSNKLRDGQVKAGEIIGLSQPTLSNILRRKVLCRKVVAFCITKYIDPEAEIEDYFERVR